MSHMTPDPTTVLAALGLGKEAASILVLLAFLGYAITHLLPYLPPPGSSGVSWWKVVYGILNGIAGNYGNARNASLIQPAPEAPVVKPPTPAA